MSRFWSSVALALLLVGCTSGRALPPVPKADEVRVTRDSRELARISDPAVVSEILTVVNRLGDGWGVPWYGPLVPEIQVKFYVTVQGV